MSECRRFEDGQEEARVVLDVFPDAGGEVAIWTRATQDDRESAMSLPHVYSISDDGEWFLLETANFWKAQNAIRAFETVTTYSDAIDLAYQAM